MATPRVRAPKSASPGEVVEIKTLISHEMESGQRKDKDGNVIPRKIINKFEAIYNGTPFFTADIEPAISANPYLSFYHKPQESGEYIFKWYDDDGSVYETSSKLDVS